MYTVKKVKAVDYRANGFRFEFAVDQVGFDGETIKTVALVESRSTAQFLADAMNATATVSIPEDSFVEV